MSVLAFFEKRRPDGRMTGGGLSGNGVRSEGAVLTGQRSPEEALRDDAERAMFLRYRSAVTGQEGRRCKQGPVYGSTKAYDPVLKSHCRL